MGQLDIDLLDRTPREVPTEELESCDVAAALGFSTRKLKRILSTSNPPSGTRAVRRQVRPIHLHPHSVSEGRYRSKTVDLTHIFDTFAGSVIEE